MEGLSLPTLRKSQISGGVHYLAASATESGVIKVWSMSDLD